MTPETAFTGLDPDAIAARVAGSIRYTIDVALPRMLHAALVRSPVACGRITAIRTADAAAAAGVVAVVTAADLDPLDLADHRFGTIVPDQPILAAGRVRHAGEPVAAVIAETEAEAVAAAAAVAVDVAEEQGVLDPGAALAPDAPLVHEGKPGNVLGRWSYASGDLEAARAASVRTFTAVYTSPAAQHVTFEPQVAVARWHDGALELWSATQSPSRIAAELARVFGLDPSAVRLHVAPLGGGYGAKNHAKLEPLAAALARIAGRPVRLANRRADEFVTTTKHPATIRIESGIDADGRFTFRDASIRWSSGAYAHSSQAVMRAGALAVCGPYRVPAARVESVMAYTNLPPAGSFRGLGANQGAWAGERQIDEIARAIGDDPVEFRRRNVVQTGDRLPTGELAGEVHWIDCLDAAVSSLGRRRSGAAVGVALAMKHTMTPSRSEAVVAALPDGTIEVRSSLVDMGQGLRTVLAQAAARELDVPAQQIRIVDPDTAVTPFDPTTSSSRGAWAGTVAVKAAAQELRRRLEGIGAGELEAPSEAVRLEAGAIVRAEQAGAAAATGLTVARLVAASGEREVVGAGVAVNEAPVDPETGTHASSSHWHQGAVAVEVDVDAETGVVEVREAHGAAWAGRVIDEGRARLQNEGGLIFGIGPALWEELGFPDGLPSAESLWDYRIPSILDAPERLLTEALEAPGGGGEPTGLGESLIPAVAPAIAAAVAAATGIEVRDLPMTPERLVGLRDPEAQPVRSPRRAAPPALSRPTTVELTVDGQRVTVSADPLAPLRDVLSEQLGLRSVRAPCRVGVCGACTVEVDGRAIRSCLRPIGLLDGSTVVTAEGLPATEPLRAAFVEAGAAQCGSCIPGAVMAARDLLGRDPAPDEEAVRRGLSGNLCRCGTYGRIVEAVVAAARRSDSE